MHFLLVSSAAAFYKHLTFGQVFKEMNRGEDSLYNPPYQQFEQPRDHFNKNDGNKWQQRYFVDDSYYKPGGPVFLELIGEWEISNKNVEKALENSLAQRYNGSHIALQHRYYGTNHSIPVSDFSNDNLAYLTETQALADAANFIVQYSKKLPKGTKWIAVGGSYAGSLAAWLRYKYPDIVFGAHSSSGPVFAKRDFYEYEDAVYDGFVPSGGNAVCQKGWINAVATFDNYASGNQKWVKEVFGAPLDIDIRDLAATTTVFSELVQYGERSSTKVEINGTKVFLHKLICNETLFPAFSNPKATSDELFYSLAQVTKLQYPTMESYREKLDTVYIAKKRNDVLWTYQYCNYYGYFQISELDRKSSMFSNFIDTEYYSWGCRQNFGSRYTQPDVAGINAMYGGLSIVDAIDNIVFVQSDLDPWRRLGVNQNTPRSKINNNVIINIPNAHHCSDLRVPDDKSPIELKKAHEQILAAWDKLLA